MMSLRCIARVLAAIVPFAAVPAVAYDSFEVRGWDGESWYDEEGFIGCAIWKDFGSQTLWVVVDGRREIVLSLDAPRLDGRRKSTADVRLTIDDAYDVWMDGDVGDGEVWLYPSSSRAFAASFKQGFNMRIDVAGDIFAFKLSGTAAALTRAEECVATETGTANQASADQGVSSGAASASSAELAPSVGYSAEDNAASATGDLYGAIAYAQGSGSMGLAWNYTSQREAESAARQTCIEERGDSSCSNVLWFRNACGAIAVADNGAYGTAWDEGAEAARMAAISACYDYGGDYCLILDLQCTD